MKYERFMHKIKKNYPEFFSVFKENQSGVYHFFENRMQEKYHMTLPHYLSDNADDGYMMRMYTYKLLQEEEDFIRFKLLL